MRKYRVFCLLLILLFPLAGMGQYGPMGIGNKDGTDAPLYGPQPKLLLWLDGTSIQSSSGKVIQWNDKSGNGNHFKQTNTNSQPLLNLGGGPAVTNCITFDGIDDRLVCPGFKFPSSSYTIYFVFKSSKGNADKYGVFSYASTINPYEVVIFNNNGFQQQAGSNTRASKIGKISDNTWNYGGIGWSAESEFLWEYNKKNTDGENTESFAEGFVISPTGTAVIGDIQHSQNGGYTGESFQGEIAEVIIWEGVMTRPISRLMRTYMHTKYGLNDVNGNWDKFQTGASGSKGQHQRLIGIGCDRNGSNPGWHSEARLDGLVLRVNPGPGNSGDWTSANYPYLCAATDDETNSVVYTDLPIGVEARWSQSWKLGRAGAIQIYKVGFDFAKGITGGKVPQGVENFVLLRRQNSSSNFQVVPSGNILEQTVVNNEVVFTLKNTAIGTSGPYYYYTIGTVNESESSLTGATTRTWYAFKDGDWHDPATWTLDGSAAPSYINPDNIIPPINHHIYIGSGKTVNVTSGTALKQGKVRIHGVLDLGSAPKPTFNTISGTGLIRCSGTTAGIGNFPSGNSTEFADPNNGGTTEFYGDGFTQSSALTVNKLRINLNSTTSVITLDQNLVHNGFFEIKKGEFRISSSTNRNVESNASVLVESEGKITVAGSGKRIHNWYFKKDFINDGVVAFTTRTAAVYDAEETQPYINALFTSGTENQELRANGSSIFSRIVIDKGDDMTYILTISSNSPDKFKLLGYCNYNMPDNPVVTNNKNSFALIRGTAEIRENVFIPLHFTPNGGGSNYNINETAMLWINGGEASKGIHPLPNNPAQAIVVFGIIKVTEGTLNANCTSGITLRQNGLLQVDGGTVNANQIRTSNISSAHIGGLLINGGVINVDGTRPGGGLGDYYILSLTYPGNLFRMTGGELNITGPTNKGLIYINSDPENTSVTGGTINVDISNNSNKYKITSRADFWNLNITRSISTGTNVPVTIETGSSGSSGKSTEITEIQPLIVRNNLSITGSNNPTLRMGDLTGQFADLYLYGNLTLEAGCIYDPSGNTTFFTGNSNSSLLFQGETKEFYNVVVNKATDTRFANIQTTGASTAMRVQGNFTLNKGYFDNGKRHVEILGNIFNKSRFGTDVIETTGEIRMNGNSGQQTIFSDNGVFHKLVIDNPDNVELQTGEVTINTSLDLINGYFIAGNHKVRFNKAYPSPLINFSSSRFIVCSGNPAAGGVEFLNAAAGEILEYKFGVLTNEEPKYTPATVTVNTWNDEGYIRITPVDTLSQILNTDGATDYLNFYWKVTHSGYTQAPLVSHLFQFDNVDVAGSTTNWVPGRVLLNLPFSRQIDDQPAADHIDLGSRFIYYNGTDASTSNTGNGTLLVNAEYSAGTIDLFSGSPKVYFSRSTNIDADWNSASNWNELSTFSPGAGVYDYHRSDHTAQTDYPKGGDIAVIGFDVSHPQLKPHVYKAPTAGIEAAIVAFTPMQLTNGNATARYNGTSSADLGVLRPTLKIASTAQISKIQQITGEGTLWLSGNIDLGITDVSGFLSEDSSVVVLATNGNMQFLPPIVPNIFSIGNPIVATDLRIRGNLEIAGSSKFILSSSIQGDLIVDGNLILNDYQIGGSNNQRLRYRMGMNTRRVTVKKDLKLLGTDSEIDIFSGISGPSPVPEEWTPVEIDALLWLDAADNSKIEFESGKVKEWKNKGTGNLNFSQDDSANMPQYVSSGMNGKAVLRFTGNQFLLKNHTATLNIEPNQDFEIFSVIKHAPGSGNTYQAIFAKGEIASGEFLLYLEGNSTSNNRYKLFFDGNKYDIKSPKAVKDLSNFGWARRQGNNGALFNSVGGSNSSPSSTGTATTTLNTYNATIGAAKNGTTRFFNGDIAEIIFVKHALTLEERQKMEGYLAHKWGLTDDLPNGHPYKAEVPMTDGGTTGPNQLIVEGNIIQQNNVGFGLNLENTDLIQGQHFVNLVLRGAGNHTYQIAGSAIPRLWKIEVDKGLDLTSGFTFNTSLQIVGPTNEAEKPIELINGKLTLDDPALNLTLSSGGGHFVIPATSGLELTAGQYNITGIETGLILEGLLKLNGANLDIGDTPGENNFIEFSSSGKSKIEIEEGTLTVGSQIRRGLTNIGGILKYKQSGGDVIIGKYAAPALKRGMLEVVNAGSSFNHTGGNITIIRGINSASTPSLLLEPQEASISSGDSKIIFGNADSPGGGEIKNMGIKSTVAINHFEISNASGEAPVAKVLSVPLEIKGNLEIDNGATLACGIQNLIIHGNVLNNGTLDSESSEVIFDHVGEHTVMGSGTFKLFILGRVGGGKTMVDTDITVAKDFKADHGIIDFGDYTIHVKGDVVADGELRFSEMSEGLVFSGNTEQKLSRSNNSAITKIDVLTIHNPEGVTMLNGASQEFEINKKLRLSSGVLGLQGNLLNLGLDAVIEELNPFGKDNMINTGGSFSNYGVRKYVYANSQEEIILPLGLQDYMPVNLNFSEGSSGSTNSSYLVKLNLPHISIVTDPDNALNMYFSINPQDIGSNCDVEMHLQYSEENVKLTGSNTEADYIAARAYKDQNGVDLINKFGSAAVDEVNHRIILKIQTNNNEGIRGHYFAAIDPAIPDNIPVYHTKTTGKVNQDTYIETVPGGGAPSGVVVFVENNDTLVFNVDFVNFYRTIIAPDAVVRINQTNFHRLGEVSGTGTIHVVGSGNLPAGEYLDFLKCDGGKLVYEGLNGSNFQILSNIPVVEEVKIIGHPNSQITFANNDVTICTDLIISNPEVYSSSGIEMKVEKDLRIESGKLNMSQADLHVLNDLKILGGGSNGGSFAGGNTGKTKIDGNVYFSGKELNLGTVNRVTEVKGNIEKTSGIVTGGTGGARLVLTGDMPQYMKGDFTGNSKIPFLNLNNPTGLWLHNNVEISDTLKLDNGLLTTGIDSMLVLTRDETRVVPAGGRPDSFVNGPMQWYLKQGSTQRVFPIGKNERYRPVQLINRSAARQWEVEYYDTVAVANAAIETLDPNPSAVPAILSVSKQEYWRIDSRTSLNTTAKVSLSWGENSAVSPDANDHSALLVLGYNPTSQQWDSYGGENHSYNVSTEIGKFNSQFAANFTERFFTLGSADKINPLPVTWLYFKGITHNETHRLSWATASEDNNEYFIIQRSLDAYNWYEVHKENGAGFSNQKTQYSWTDFNPPFGIVYYRIIQIDFDGKSKLHPTIVSLELKSKNDFNLTDFTIYPNPSSTGEIRIKTDDLKNTAVRITIADMTGKVLEEKIIQIDQQGISETINSRFRSGFYILTLTQNNKINSKPFIISQ